MTAASLRAVIFARPIHLSLQPDLELDACAGEVIGLFDRNWQAKAR